MELMSGARPAEPASPGTPLLLPALAMSAATGADVAVDT
jgi:hypothetical protein